MGLKGARILDASLAGKLGLRGWPLCTSCSLSCRGRLHLPHPILPPGAEPAGGSGGSPSLTTSDQPLPVPPAPPWPPASALASRQPDSPRPLTPGGGPPPPPEPCDPALLLCRGAAPGPCPPTPAGPSCQVGAGIASGPGVQPGGGGPQEEARGGPGRDSVPLAAARGGAGS